MNQEYIDLAVAGLHLTGQPLNHQLITLGGVLIKTCRTASRYKMYLIEDERGRRPGLSQVPHGGEGNAYEIEVWSLPLSHVGKFLAMIPPPLGLGTVILEDGALTKGFICEPRVVEEGKDISEFDGWKAFCNATT